MTKVVRQFAFLWLCALVPCPAVAQTSAPVSSDQQTGQRQSEFGPNVQAYLDYLSEQMTVTDARESQREISRAYYRHNLNRVRALRQFAVKHARATREDFIPELEAVTPREFNTLFFERAPKPSGLQVNTVYNESYRYLGTARSGETFYIFARLDPFEEEALRKAQKSDSQTASNAIEKSVPSGMQSSTVIVVGGITPESEDAPQSLEPTPSEPAESEERDDRQVRQNNENKTLTRERFLTNLKSSPAEKFEPQRR